MMRYRDVERLPILRRSGPHEDPHQGVCVSAVGGDAGAVTRHLGSRVAAPFLRFWTNPQNPMRCGLLVARRWSS